MQNNYYLWAKQGRYQAPYPVSEHFRIYSYATDRHAAGRLLRSVHHWKIPLILDGVGQPFGSFMDKWIGLKHYLGDRSIADDEIIMVIDAYDTFLVGDMKEIVSAFKRMKMPLVFYSELVIGPDLNIHAFYPQAGWRHIFRYVNAGGVIGYAGPLRKMLEEMPMNKPCQDFTGGAHEDFYDQRCLTNYFLRHQNEVGLDYRQEIFSTLQLIYDKKYLTVLTDGRVINHLGKGQIRVLHGNGTGRNLFKDLVAKVEESWKISAKKPVK